MSIHTLIRSLIESVVPTAAAHCDTADGPEERDVLSKMRISGVMEACRVCHGEDIEIRYKFVHQPTKREELDVWE